jgi:hypothetical protein
MVSLGNANLVIRITGSREHVINTFLRVFLANERLTDKQLEVTTALVSRYAEYVFNGVREPYASTILFSTETRKDVVDQLKISAAHLNNTFNALTKKNILAREGDKYIMNPGIIPNSTIKFEFTIKDAEQGQDN